jgi:exonuclease SbcD
VTIDCDCRQATDPTNEVLAAIARREVADAIVRVRVELRPDQEAGLKERTIRAALAEAYDIAAISRVVEGAARSRWGAINVEALTPMQQLELYFSSSQTPEAQMKGLLADADAIIREVDAVLMASS